jgi:type II secretory pathway pseudopilin PulG
MLALVAGRAREQEGFTLIEVLVAAFLTLVILGAMVASLAAGQNGSYAAQRESELVEAANQQLESVRQLVKLDGFSALALSSLPAAASSATLKFHSTTPLDPNSFVTTCGATDAYEIEANYDSTGSGLVSTLPAEAPCATAGLEPLITGGQLSPAPTAVTIGGMTVNLYEYVTETSVGCNSSFGNGSCTDDARRVIVAAVDAQAQADCSSATTPNLCAQSGDAPVYLSTIFTNPTPSNANFDSSVGITLGVQLG